MGEARDYAAGLGAGVGGLMLGRGLADSNAANDLLVRLLTRRASSGGRPDFRVPVYAGADLNLAHGSGEAVMASRISDMLNRHGIGSYFVNTQSPHSNADIAAGKVNRPWISPAVRNNPYFWSSDTRIKGSDLDNLKRLMVDLPEGKVSALDALVARMGKAGVSADKARRAIASGLFDGFTPGELYDTLAVSGKQGIQDIAAGRRHLMANSKFRELFDAGRLPHTLTGEGGMRYSSLVNSNLAKAIAENTYPYPQAPKTRNLTLDTQFQANYRGPADKLIPGSGMYDPGFGRRSRLARLWKYYAPKSLGGGERAEYHAAIKRLAEEAGVDVKTLTPKMKYMLISTGSAGANAAEKLRLAEAAFGNDPNVKILLQYGKKDPASGGLDIYTNNGLKEELARIKARHPNLVIPFDKDNAYGLLARNVDLHGAYGGSSSITEALANTNPTVAMGDTYLNIGNNRYGNARRGIKMVGSDATALLRERDRLGNGGLGTVINSRDNSLRLGDALKLHGIEGANLAQKEQEAVQALRDAMYNGKSKFSRETVSAANRMLREQAGRNKSFVDTVRRLVSNAIAKHDDAAYRSMRPGAGKALRGVIRSLFRTPAGRRVGVPLALMSALGLGGGAYAASRNLHSGGDWNEKIRKLWRK